MKLKHLLACALCAAVLCSCGTREDLFGSYDSCFVPIGRNSASFVLTPETQGLMIPGESYTFSFAKIAKDDGIMFSLSCPVECDSYEWKVTRDEKPSEVLSDKTNGTYMWNIRNVGIYIENSEDCIFCTDVAMSNISCWYRIHLSVKVGTQYFYDSATLCIAAPPSP